MGLVSVSVLVSESAGHIHLNDNMRCKGATIRLPGGGGLGFSV